MNPRSQLSLWSGALWLGLVCAAVAGAAAYAVSHQLPNVYEAQASLLVPTMADTYADIAVSRPLLERVISELELPETPEALSDKVAATASKTSALLTIVALDSDANRAAAIANEMAAQVLEIAPTIGGSSPEVQTSIQADLLAAQTQITRLGAAIAALSGQSELTPAQVEEMRALQAQLATLLEVRSSLLGLRVSYSQTVLTLIEPAQPPDSPSSPRPTLAMITGGIAGLAIGVGVALLGRYLRKSPGTGRFERDRAATPGGLASGSMSGEPETPGQGSAA